MTTSGTTPAGWYPDPSLRHEHRYWDGTAWSSQVSDRGIATTDPELQPATSPHLAPAEPAPHSAAAASAVAAVAGPGLGPAAVTPAAAPPGRAGWAAPLAAVVAVLAVVAG